MATYRIVKKDVRHAEQYNSRIWKDFYVVEKLVLKPKRNWWGKVVGTKESWKFIDWWYGKRECEDYIGDRLKNPCSEDGEVVGVYTNDL